MVKPLSDTRRRQLAGGLILFALVYLVLTGKEFAASVFASNSDLTKLRRAVTLSPGNADYQHRLGTFFSFTAGDPQAALESYRRAVALNPFDASYWLDLAAACQVTGDLDGQRAALDRAIAAEPTAPAVAWRAANFFLVDGQIDRALGQFHAVMEGDSTMVPECLQACWRVRPDVDALLQNVVPLHIDPLNAFLSLLMTRQETEGTLKTWQRLVETHEKFSSNLLFGYVQYLIQVRRPDAAMTAWEQAAAPLGLAGYLPTEDNLVINGDFSLNILNGGFDWTYVNRSGVRPLLDASDFRQGHRSLSLTFEGPGISDAGIQELIPVHGATAYDFSAYYKSADFEGAGGPTIVLHDAYTNAVLFASDPLTDADFWKEVHSTFTTPAPTTLLRLVIERSPAGSPIRGKLWLDDFQLSPDNADEDAADSTTDDKADSKSNRKEAH